VHFLQADLSSQIDSTKRQLSGINADLASVKASVNSMVVKIDVVKRNYVAQVNQLQQLDVQLDRITVEESVMTVNLRDRKALLAERLRQAYDTDRTSMLETFLSAGSFTDVLSQVSYSIDVGEQDKALAAKLAGWRERALAVAFVIGSADGLDPAVKRNADAVLALSALTLPHGLARVVLAEQLYRATSLLSGHPYHRE